MAWLPGLWSDLMVLAPSALQVNLVALSSMTCIQRLALWSLAAFIAWMRDHSFVIPFTLPDRRPLSPNFLIYIDRWGNILRKRHSSNNSVNRTTSVYWPFTKIIVTYNQYKVPGTKLTTVQYAGGRWWDMMQFPLFLCTFFFLPPSFSKKTRKCPDASFSRRQRTMAPGKRHPTHRHSTPYSVLFYCLSHTIVSSSPVLVISIDYYKCYIYSSCDTKRILLHWVITQLQKYLSSLF